MAGKSFTNGKDDKQLVGQLYREAFAEQCGKAETLNYTSLGWGDEEAARLAAALRTGAFAKVEAINLERNQIGDAGMRELAAAVAGGALPVCKVIDLDRNPGDKGPVGQALAERRKG